MSEEQVRDQALALYEAGLQSLREHNYRDAQTRLDDLLKLIDHHADLQELAVNTRDLLNKVREGARAMVEEVKPRLEKRLREEPVYQSPIGIDIDQTDEFLEEINHFVQQAVARWRAENDESLSMWKNALLDPAGEADYNRMVQRLTNRALVLERDLKAAGVIDVCQRLWERGEALMGDTARTVDIANIIERYYDKARRIASAGLGNDPDNIDLITLHKRAEAERERYAVGAQVLTSAVQAGEYRRSLKELEGLPPTQLVPSYRFLPNAQGQLEARPEGYISISEARNRILEMAANWAHTQALEYLDRAERALRNHQPKLAQIELGNREKIDTFLDSTDWNEFDKLQGRVEADLQRLSEAERLAEQARQRLPDHPFDAWSLYQRAVQSYEWEPSLLTTRDAIVYELRNLLDQRHRQADEAFHGRDFDRLKRLVTQTRDQFSSIDDPLLTTALDAINALDERSVIYGNRLRSAQIQLQEIERQINQDPQEMLRQLDQLEQDYADVLDGLKDLARVRSDARLRSDAAAARDRLRRFSTNRNLAEVRQALIDARNALTRFPNDTGFQQLVERLRLHQLFLEAQRDESNGLYQDALTKYREVAEVRDHEDAGAARTKLAEVQESIVASEDITRRLDEARQRIDRDPVEAYLRLQSLDIRNPDQRLERDQYMIEARNQAQAIIAEQMRRWERLTDVSKLPIDRVRSDLDTLGKLGLVADQERWMNSLGVQIAVQEAQVLTDEAFRVGSAAQLIEASTKWENALKLAETAGKTLLANRARTELNRTRKKHVEMRYDRLLRLLRESGSDTPEAIAEATSLETEIARMQSLYPNDPEIEVWRVQLAFVTGVNSLKPARREEAFTRAGSIAQSAVEMLTRNPSSETLLRDARGILQVVPARISTARMMTEIEQIYGDNYLSVQKLLQAQAIWRQVTSFFEGDNSQHFEVIRRWWEALNADLVSKLRGEIDAERIETWHFSTLALLLVLQPEDQTAKSVIEQLDIYKEILRLEVQNVLEGLKTANGIAGTTGLQVLNNQRGQAADLDSDLHAIQQLAQLYQDDPTRSAMMYAVLDEVGDTQLKLKDAIDSLDSLAREVNEVINRLNTEMQTGKFDISETMLTRIKQRFPNHPATQYIEEERLRRIQERQVLLAEMAQVRELFESEDYETAVQRMSRMNVALLTTYDLADDYEVVDPKPPSQTIIGWENVLSLVQARSESGAVPRVVAFAEPFDDYSSGKGAITGSERPTRRAVDWADARSRIEMQLARGEFDAARDSLALAVVESGDSNIIPLSKIMVELMNPPYIRPLSPEEAALAERDESQRYPLARQHADSWRGERILEQLEQERIPYYRKVLESAAALERQIETSRREWEEGWAQWESAIRDIAVQFSEHGLKGRLSQKARSALCGALKAAYQAYRRCQNACSAHKALREMENLYLYNYALSRLKFDPSQEGG